MAPLDSAARFRALSAPRSDQELIFGLRKLGHTSLPDIRLEAPQNDREILLAQQRKGFWNWFIKQKWADTDGQGPRLGLFWYSREAKDGIFVAPLLCDLRFEGCDFGDYIVPPGDPDLFWPEVKNQVPMWQSGEERQVLSGRVFFDKPAWVFGVLLPPKDVGDSAVQARICEVFGLPVSHVRFIQYRRLPEP